MGLGPIRIGRPSPAMLVAIIALFLALGGTGYAALSGKDKKKVKRIADTEISKAAPGLSVKQATSADQLAGVPAAEFQRRLWAVVRTDGTLARGAGAISSDKSNPGNYHVTFNRDITGCAWIAAIGDPADGGQSFGEIEAQVTSVTTAPNSISVFTANSSGGISDRAFHLIVDC